MGFGRTYGWIIVLLLICNTAFGQRMLVNGWRHGGGPPAYDTDAQAFITACAGQGVTLNTTQEGAINQLVLDLKAASIWTKFYAIYPMIGGAAGSHKLNLKDPRDLDAAYRLSFLGGAITHNSTGVAFVTNRYANTFLNANTVLSTNNWHISFYSATTGTGGFDIGTYKTNSPSYGTMIGIRTGGAVSYAQNGTPFTSAATSGNSLYTLTRTANNRADCYRLGTSISNQTATTSDPHPSFEIYLGAYNGSGSAASYGGRTCSFASIGQSFNSTEMSAFATAVQAYQLTLSRRIL